MRDASLVGYKPEQTADGFKALVRRRAVVDGGVVVLVSADEARGSMPTRKITSGRRKVP